MTPRSRCAINAQSHLLTRSYSTVSLGLASSMREGNAISSVLFITGVECYERNPRDICFAIKILGVVNVRYCEKTGKIKTTLSPRYIFDIL